MTDTRDTILDSIEADLAHDPHCCCSTCPRDSRRLAALKSLRAEVVDLRERDPNRLCLCGHGMNRHFAISGAHIGGCSVHDPVKYAEEKNFECPCLGFKEPS